MSSFSSQLVLRDLITLHHHEQPCHKIILSDDTNMGESQQNIFGYDVSFSFYMFRYVNSNTFEYTLTLCINANVRK